ncbi:MAG: heavy-metal-associated domain-containing protein [Anaerolineae bacterium]
MTLETKTLKVIGERTIHCGGCEHTVKFALKQLPTVRQVEASHRTQLINLTFEPEALDLARVRRELEWIGYQVAEIEEA